MTVVCTPGATWRQTPSADQHETADLPRIFGITVVGASPPRL
jgi:hypothetical protein